VLEQFSTEDAPYLELAQESAITLIKQTIRASTAEDPAETRQKAKPERAASLNV
jgi:hypothetical protein